MVIIKLGGSLFHSPLLQDWLNKLTQLSKHEPIIIVPGGGPFADQIRQAQQHHQFDDQHAHHMALLAMSQYGLLLLGLCQDAQPFYYPEERINNNCPALSIWLPDKRLLKEEKLSQNWDVTSDSIALWLAQELNPNKLTLLKHQQNKQQYSVQQLTNIGLLDNAFSAQYHQTEITIELVNVNQVAAYSTTQPAHPLVP
jgi:aspartokinase-like uncharacterized kinase